MMTDKLIKLNQSPIFVSDAIAYGDIPDEFDDGLAGMCVFVEDGGDITNMLWDENSFEYDNFDWNWPLLGDPEWTKLRQKIERLEK